MMNTLEKTEKYTWKEREIYLKKEKYTWKEREIHTLERKEKYTHWKKLNNALSSAGFATTATQTFSCGWHELDWGGGWGEVGTFKTSENNASWAVTVLFWMYLLMSSSLNFSNSKVGHFQNSWEQCSLSYHRLYIKLLKLWGSGGHFQDPGEQSAR